VTSVEIPFSIAAALPSLSVLDITNDVKREVAGHGSGIAYISPNGHPSLVRVQERESGFFEDLQCLLDRLVPTKTLLRERMLSMLLGPRTEQVPFTDGRLALGQWQRILYVSFDESAHCDWTLTVLG
jgi:thiamine phosphate synthase YjbQ (UPF0047 family)